MSGEPECVSSYVPSKESEARNDSTTKDFVIYWPEATFPLVNDMEILKIK